MSKNIALKKEGFEQLHHGYEVNLVLSNIGATNHLARLMAHHTENHGVIALKGELGVGKTAFTRAFINSFFDKPQEILSPTFGLLQTFVTAEFAINHYDLYRLKNAGEALEIGLEESFSNDVTIIEWPEIIAELLPENRVEIALGFGPEEETRMVTIHGFGAWKTLLKEIFN